MDADAHLAAEGHEMTGDARKLSPVRSYEALYLGQPRVGILCSKKGGVGLALGRWRSRSVDRALAARILVPGILSRPNHPPLAPTLDLGTVSPPELERAAGTTRLDASK